MPMFLNLPTSQPVRRAPLDFSGLGKAIDEYKQKRDFEQQNKTAGILFAQSQRDPQGAVRGAFEAGDRGLAGLFLKQQAAAEAAKRGPEPTALMRNLIAGGLKPGTPEFRDAILNGTKRGTVINNQLPGAEKGTNKLTEKLAEQAAGVFDQAASAQDLANKYNQINEYAQNPDVRTGTLGGLELGIKKIGNTVFGLEFDGLPEAEQIQKVGDLLVGDIREMQGDTRMSDADRRAYRAIPPNLGDSKQGIMLATEIMQKTAKGMAARQQALSDLVANNGGNFDTRVWAQYNQYINQNPLITIEDVRKARALAKTAKQNTPGAGMLPQIEEELKRRGIAK